MSNRDIAWYIGLKIAREELDHKKIWKIKEELEEFRKGKNKRACIEKIV